jgi:hypothetical protein
LVVFIGTFLSANAELRLDGAVARGPRAGRLASTGTAYALILRARIQALDRAFFSVTLESKSAIARSKASLCVNRDFHFDSRFPFIMSGPASVARLRLSGASQNAISFARGASNFG